MHLAQGTLWRIYGNSSNKLTYILNATVPSWGEGLRENNKVYVFSLDAYEYLLEWGCKHAVM